MRRSLEQNDCLHKWCRVIAKHLQANDVRVSEETVKELILRKLGNCLLIENIPGMEPDIIAMRSSKYVATDAELSALERKRGFISMTNLLNQVEAWAAHDLGLNLKREEDENESSTRSIAIA